ncbi:MAG: hypothetical protein ABFR36_01625 [Acidobacteriota bacterium]
MKSKLIILFILVFILPNIFHGEIFSRFADPNKDYLERIKGEWVFSNRKYLYEFTDVFVRKIDGFRYYKYKSSKHPGYDNFLFAIFKSRKTGVSFFTRGNWDKKRGFIHTSSRIRFIGKDKFMVFSKDNMNEIYFTAKRYVQKQK